MEVRPQIARATRFWARLSKLPSISSATAKIKIRVIEFELPATLILFLIRHHSGEIKYRSTSKTQADAGEVGAE